MFRHLLGAKKHGKQLIAPFSDLIAHGPKGNLIPKMAQSFLPRARVQVDRVQKSAVDIEDHSFFHNRKSAIRALLYQREPSGNSLADITLEIGLGLSSPSYLTFILGDCTEPASVERKAGSCLQREWSLGPRMRTAATLCHQPFVNFYIFFGHAAGRKPLTSYSPAF